MTTTQVDPLAHARELVAAGQAANEDMRPEVGRRRLRAALAQLGDPGDDGPDARELRGRTLISLALAEAELGHLDLGMTLLADAAPLVPAEQQGVLHAQRAILLRRSGRDDLALGQYGEALARMQLATQPELVAKVLMNRSVLHVAGGDLPAARRDLDHCLELAQSMANGVLVAKALHNLGFLEYTAGNLPAALRHYEEAEPHYRRLLPGNLAMLGLDRARALVAAGLVTEADRELLAAVEQLRKQRSYQDQAEGLLVRAEAMLLDSRPREARRLASTAHALLRRRDNQRWAARALLTIARADLAAGRRTDVAGRAEQLEESFVAWGLVDDARTAAMVAALAYVRSGEIDRARSLVASPAPRAGRLDTTLLCRMARAEIAEAEGRHRDAAGERRRGLDALQRARTRIGALDLQGSASLLGRELARAGLERAVATGSPAAVLAWAERSRAQALLLPPVRLEQDDHDTWQTLRATTLALSAAELDGRPTGALRAQREALRKTIRQSAWAQVGPGTSAPVVTLRTVSAVLESSAMVVYVADGHGGLCALVITDRRPRLVRLGPLAVAEEAVFRLRADLDAGAGRSLPSGLSQAVARARRRDADVVSAALVDELLPLVGDRHLVIVPTGGIITAPWSALPATQGRPVTVAPSASSWVARQSAVTTGPRTVLAGGPRVSHAEAEIAAIAGLNAAQDRPLTVLVRDRATVAATLAALSNADIAHVAAHGHHETDNALFSGIELTDGLLMGYDVLGLPRVPPVVVLSSCDLGLHDTRPGDESLGIASAFIAAGACTVIASVARVEEDDAMTVMVDVHRSLLAGSRPGEALAAATRELAAGFVCFGAG